MWRRICTRASLKYTRFPRLEVFRLTSSSIKLQQKAALCKSTMAILCVGCVIGNCICRTEEQEEKVEHFLSNWSCTHECQPRALYEPENVAELKSILQIHHAQGKKIRCVGAGISPNGIGFSSKVKYPKEDVTLYHEDMVSVASLDKVLNVDTSNNCVTVETGIKVDCLLEHLRSHGLTLKNVASIRDQQIGGLLQSGCHGTGAKIPPMDAQIEEMILLTPGEGEITLSASKQPEVFALAKCGLGALGILTKVTLQCVPVHYLIEKTIVINVEQIRQHHTEWLTEFQHLRYMWIPYTDCAVVVQCKQISLEEMLDLEKFNAKFPSSSIDMSERLAPAQKLYRNCCGDRADPTYTNWDFFTMRDQLIALDPLNKEHIKLVNEIEMKFWKLGEGYRIGLSDNIISFDCGGQQLVHEIAFPVYDMNDIDCVAEILQEVDRANIPCPAPIEQRWSAPSTSSMSPASSSDPNQVFCWIGTIMYLPTSEINSRKAITKQFGEYNEIVRNVKDRYNGFEHWAKLEWPEDEEKRRKLQEKFRARYPLDSFRKARDTLDPKHILSNEFVDRLLEL
ncbi:hypothetical protein ABG067_007036 [Albugo candida]